MSHFHPGNEVVTMEGTDVLVNFHSISFLQGLLLMEMRNIPKKFSKYKKLFKNFYKICKNKKMTKYEVCLKYVLSNNYIDKVIVGIDSANQFKKLINSAGYIEIPKKSVDASKEINLINPAKW